MVAAVLQHMAPLTTYVPPNSDRTALSTALEAQIVKTAERPNRATGEAALEALLEGLMRDGGTDGMCRAVPPLQVLPAALVRVELGHESLSCAVQVSRLYGSKDLIGAVQVRVKKKVETV